MNRFIRLTNFHLKLYLKNQYFLWLTISSTISITILQYLFAYSSNNLNDPQIWIRSGVFGLWASATTATGVIGFQRFQGTLPYLINTKCGDITAFTTLILPASIFGLLSFPLSYVISLILGLDVSNLSFTLITNIILFWLGAFILDLFIATFFVLTRNAIIYEEFITIPIPLLSGLFGYPNHMHSIYKYARWISPLSYPINNLLYKKDHILGFLAYIISLILWLYLANILLKKILFLSKKKGSLKII